MREGPLGVDVGIRTNELFWTPTQCWGYGVLACVLLDGVELCSALGKSVSLAEGLHWSICNLNMPGP